MSNEFIAMSNGTFTLHESENPNVFYFYRNDGRVLGDNIGYIVMDFYRYYCILKMMTPDAPPEMIISNLSTALSSDGKSIRLTIGGDSTPKKKQNIFQRLFRKLFK